VPQFFNGAPTQFFEMPHTHRLDETGLLALAFSRSYMPARDSHEGSRAAVELRDAFAAHASPDGDAQSVTMHYTTVAIIGRPRPAQA
jgi:hypothetical protein